MTGPRIPVRCGMRKCVSGLPPRPYPSGWFCARCSPSARAGVPEPDELLKIAKERRALEAAALGAEVAG